MIHSSVHQWFEEHRDELDALVFDVDGVLVVPRDLAYDVLVRSEEIKANEKKIFGWVAEGQSIHQITEKGGCF